MDGSLTAKAVLSGRVNAIPLIDSTLTKEGQAADAKATGDALAEQKGRIDNISLRLGEAKGDISVMDMAVENNTLDLQSHDARITNNATEIDKTKATLAVSQGRLSTAEDEIATLQGQMETANEGITGLGNRMTNAEVSIAALQGKDAELAEQIKTVNDDLTTAKGKLDETTATVTNTVGPDLTQAKNDIATMQSKLDSIDPNQITGLAADMADVKTKLGVSAVTVTPIPADGVTVEQIWCVKNGAVYMLLLCLKNTTDDTLNIQKLCEGLPKPSSQVYAVGYDPLSADGGVYTVFLHQDGTLRHSPNGDRLPSGGLLRVTLTFISTDE